MAPFQRALAPLLVMTFALVATSEAVAQLDPSSPWPRWAGSNANNGVAIRSQPSGYIGDRIRWPHVLPEGDRVEAGIVLTRDGKAIVPTWLGHIYCLDVETGDLRWDFNTGVGLRAWTPALIVTVQQVPPPGSRDIVPGGSSYAIPFGCGDRLYRISEDPQTHEPEVDWVRAFPGYTVSSCPAVSEDGVIYVGLEGGPTTQYYSKVVALRQRDGVLLWSLNLPQYDQFVHTSPAIGPSGRIYVTAQGSFIYGGGALCAITGAGTHGVLEWAYRVSWNPGDPNALSKAFDSPCIGDGADPLILFGSQDNDPFQPKTGTLWAVKDGGAAPIPQWSVGGTNGVRFSWFESSPVIDPQGYVYVGTQDSSASARDGRFIIASGGVAQVLFTSAGELPTENNVDATACIAIDAQGQFLAVFETKENGYLHKLDRSGNELWGEPLRVHRTDLISAAMGPDGTVYFGTRDHPTYDNRGRVYAIWGFDQ